MRLLSYSTQDGPSWGVVCANGVGVVDLSERLGHHATDLGQLIERGLIDEARAFMGEAPDHPLDEITFERVLPWPRKIFCIGVNYRGRSGEYADPAAGEYPSVFVRFPDSLTGHDRLLLRPPESVQLDYEGEIVIVIGKEGRRIPRAEARDHIAGLTLGNEGTIRDWVRHGKFNVTQGKNWPSSGSLGPWLLTINQIDDLDRLHLTTRVNGDVRQDDTTASMAFPIDLVVHYLSTFTTLRPGDVVFTGTPIGAGARLDPPRWLEPGDVIEVTVPGIGTLRNTVADEVVQ